MIGARGGQEGVATGKHQPGGAPHPNELGTGGQYQIACAIDARRQRERSVTGGGLLDGALQGAALVLGTPRLHP